MDQPAPTETATWQSRFFSASDGLKLHVREIGDRAATRLPVVCLAGLTRSSEDFARIGARLAARCDRWVIAPDYRGRGLSGYDPNWRNYDVKVELTDLMTVLAALGIDRAIFIGTSRGGLLTALVAISAPALLAGAVINDIGPVVEMRGLARIRGYVGKVPTPASHAEGAEILKRMFGAQFPGEADESWLRFAERSWKQEGGQLVPKYDRNLMKPLAELDFEAAMPELWAQFDALKHAPLLVIRGGLTDLLSEETALKMVERHGNARFHLVPDQGHAPLLEDEPTMAAIETFVASCG